MKLHITKDNVFDNLGFDKIEASNLKIRAVLMRVIEEELNKKSLTEVQESKLLGVSQSKINNLKQGKMHFFNIDTLVEMLFKLGKTVHLVIDDRMVT